MAPWDNSLGVFFFLQCVHVCVYIYMTFVLCQRPAACLKDWFSCLLPLLNNNIKMAVTESMTLK